MSEFEVQIVELPPMKAAAFPAYSETPEIDAIMSANNWLKSNDIFKKGAYRQFGFNNPSPSPGSLSYGYEVWIFPNDELPIDMNVSIKEFSGGLYAVSLCSTIDTVEKIWEQLFNWRETSEYQPGEHQWLEEMLDPPVEIEELRLLLYLPLKN